MTETNGKNDQVIITRDHLYRFRRTLVALGAVFEGGCNGGGLGCEQLVNEPNYLLHLDLCPKVPKMSR